MSHTVASEPKTVRIIFSSVLLGGLGAAYLIFTMNRPFAPPREPCEHVPANVKELGPALDKKAIAAALDDTEEGFAVRSKMRQGDTLHEYETGTTGGHLVLRRHCYVGHVARWMR